MLRFKILLSMTKKEEQHSSSSSAKGMFVCNGEVDTRVLIVIGNVLYVTYKVFIHLIG
jgi:hypothetical protein